MLADHGQLGKVNVLKVAPVFSQAGGGGFTSIILWEESGEGRVASHLTGFLKSGMFECVCVCVTTLPVGSGLCFMDMLLRVRDPTGTFPPPK